MTADTWNHRGARTLVVLHERELRAFLKTWYKAAAVQLPLPATDDPNYQTLTSLLRHVLRAARGYLIWTCDTLELPAPDIAAVPAEDSLAAQADAYLDTLLAAWDGPLRGPSERDFDREAAARWGPTYCVDGMLEHAVMHPIRHRFQLEELLATHG